MEHTFLYQKALAEKGIKKSQLPEAVKADLSKFTTMCKELIAIPEENKDEIDAKNEEIDILDESIAEAINNLPAPTVVTAPQVAPVVTDPPANTPKEEESDNTGVVLVVLGLIGAGIWAGIKFLGGKQK